MKPTPVSMHKHRSCAVFKIKLTTGSGNAGTVKNSTAGAGSDSGKKRVCVQEPLLFLTIRLTDQISHLQTTFCSLKCNPTLSGAVSTAFYDIQNNMTCELNCSPAAEFYGGI
jgi:hypothetical protein